MVKPAVKKPTASEVVVHSSRRKTQNNDSQNNEKKTTKKSKEEFKPKPSRKESNNDSGDENEAKQQFLSLKQAKFDVFKFGIKGFSKEDQEQAKIKLAIKLGAKPPKNKSMNYKQLMDLKKEEKDKLEQLKSENRQFEAKVALAHSNLSSYKKKKPKTGNSQRRAKINRGDVGHIKGHIGSFSNGVLKIKNNALKRLK